MTRFDDVVAFHGHACPGLALGYRVSLRAIREFGERSADEELVAVVENSSCAVDAVQVMTGCTFGKGNLIFRDFGKQVYTFIMRRSGRSLRIAVDWKRREETAEETAAWERYAKGDRSRRVLRIVHDLKAKKIRDILDAADRDVMKVRRGKAEVPPAAGIFPSLTCQVCGEKVMEPRARLRGGMTVCMPCLERRT